MIVNVYLSQSVQRDVLYQDIACRLDRFKSMHNRPGIDLLGKDCEQTNICSHIEDIAAAIQGKVSAEVLLFNDYLV